MAETKDTYELQAIFDSKHFDDKIRQSQKTVEDFKKSLNFDSASKQMQGFVEGGSNVASAIMSMAENVGKLTQDLVGFGNLTTYLKKRVKTLWEEAARSAENFAKSLTLVQKNVGSDKYDRLLKSVQTIKNATNESEEVVYGVMNTLNKYTDETSYNFTEMADSIGKFTTAGVKLVDAEKELEGIANWAALAGQGVNEANRAMYNISQAMSAGAMKLIDYKSIQNANMDIREFRQQAIEAAVAVGTLIKKGEKFYTTKGNKEVNLDNFTQTLQYTWLSREAMEKTFQTFGDQSTEIGMKAYKAAQRCVTFSDALNAIKDMLSTGWMQTYEHIFGKLSDAMNLFSGLCNKASDMLAKFMETRNGILQGWSYGGGRNSLWATLVGEIESPDGETLFKGAYGLLDLMQSLADGIFNSFWSYVRRFVSAENLAGFDADDDHKFAFLAAAIHNLTNEIQQFVNSIGDFFNEVPDGYAESRGDQIRHVIEGVYGAFTILGRVFGTVVSVAMGALHQLQPAFDAVFYIFGQIGSIVTGVSVAEVKTNGFGGIVQWILGVTQSIAGVVNRAAISVAVFVSHLGDYARKIAQTEIWQNISKWFSDIAASIPEAVSSVVAWGSKVLKSAKNSKKFQQILDSIKETIKSLPNFISSIGDTIKGKFGNIKDFFGEVFKNVLDFWIPKAGAESLDEQIAEAVMPKEDSGNSIIQKLKDRLTSIWTKIKDAFNTFFNETIPNFMNSDFAKGVGKFFEGTTFNGLLDKFIDIKKWGAIGSVGTGLFRFGSGLKKSGKGIQVLGKHLKDLNLSGIFKDMFNISNVINSNNTNKNKSIELGNLGNTLLQIAAAVGILTLSAMKLSEIPQDKLEQAGIAIAAMLGGLTLAGIAAKYLTGGSTGILMIAAAVFILTQTIDKISALPWDKFIDVGEKLGAIVAALASSMRIATLGTFGQVSLKGVIGFVLGVILLLVPLKILEKETDKTFWPAVWKLEALMLMLSISAAMASAFNHNGKGLKGMIGFALSMLILMAPLKIMAGMKLDEIGTGLAGLAVIMLGIGVLVRKTDNKEAGKLAGLVGALAALTAIGWIVGKTMDWKQMLVGFGPIVALLVAMGVFFSQASKMNIEQIAAIKKIFTTLAAVMAVMAGTILLVSYTEAGADTIISFFAGVSAIIVAAGLMIKLSKDVKKGQVGKLAVVMLMAGVLAGLAAGSLFLVEKVDVNWDVILAFFSGVAVMAFGVAAALAITSKIQDVKAGIKGAVILGVGAAALMAAVAAIGPLVVSSLGNTLVRLGNNMKVVSGSLRDFFTNTDSITESSASHATAIFEEFFKLVKKFAGAKGYEKDIQSVMTQMKYLGTALDMFFVNSDKYTPDSRANMFGLLQEFIDKKDQIQNINFGNAPNSIVELGVGLLFFDTAVSNITKPYPPAVSLIANLDMVTAHATTLRDLGSSISESIMYLGVGLGLFEYSTRDITNDKPKALSLLEGIFGQADNIEKFTKLPLETFTGQMSGLGGAMSLYAQGAREVTGLKVGSDDIHIEGSIEILKAVCDSLSGENGKEPFKIPENIPDSTALGLFAGQLESLGKALAGFGNGANSFKGNNATKSMELLKVLGVMGGYITVENLGVTNVFTNAGVNESTLGQFAIDVGALGTALGKFAELTNNKTFDNGLGAVTKLSDINSNLTTDSLKFIGAFKDSGTSGDGQTGDSTPLGKFSIDVGALGTALSSFSTLTENKTFDSGLGALDHFEDLNHKLTSDRLAFANAFKDADIHKSELDTFSDDIGALGHSLASFINNVAMSSDQESDFYSAIRGLTFLASLEARLSKIKVGGISSWWAGNGMRLADLQTDLAGLGSGLKDFYGSFAGIKGVVNDEEMKLAQDSLTVVEQLVRMVSSMSDNAQWKTGTLSDLLDMIVGSYYKETNRPTSEIADQIADFAVALSGAFAEYKDVDFSMIGLFKDLAEGIADLASIDPSLEFKTTGFGIISGIADGIRNGESTIIDAVIDAVRAGIDAGNIEAGIDKAVTSGTVGNTTELVAQISEAMSEEMGDGPVITPVLDLSNVTGAKGEIESILSGEFSLNLGDALAKAIQSLNSNGPTEVVVQNPTDLTGIQSALGVLQSEIASLGSAISNIKIVMNSGVVAGAVTDHVDVNLGRKSLYASRRNATFTPTSSEN